LEYAILEYAARTDCTTIQFSQDVFACKTQPGHATCVVDDKYTGNWNNNSAYRYTCTGTFNVLL